MGREEFGPRDGESPEVFHARLFEKAEQLMAKRPEQRARDGAARLIFTDGAFGTVPGAGQVAARAGEWTTRLRGQLDRVAAEVTDLKEGTRTAKELAIDVDGATQAIARRGATALTRTTLTRTTLTGRQPVGCQLSQSSVTGEDTMAGSFAEAQAQIRSLRPDELTAKAGQLREIGIDLRLCGSELGASADEVGSQRGRPYATYRDRVTPTATYLRDLQNPANTVAEGLDRSATAGKQAGMVLAEQEQLLAELASRPTTTPAQFAAAEAQALAVVNRAIDAVSQAYATIAPPTPAACAGGGRPAPGHATAPGWVGRATRPGRAGRCGPGRRGPRDGGAGTSAVLGPEAGALAGFVADPLSGNLIDPASGREVDAGGRFVDPITGEPFGEPSPFATRLEGLVGGAAPGVLPRAGSRWGRAPAGRGARARGGRAGRRGYRRGRRWRRRRGGAVPAAGGFGAGVGARGEAGRIAGLYGGAVRPACPAATRPSVSWPRPPPATWSTGPGSPSATRPSRPARRSSRARDSFRHR